MQRHVALVTGTEGDNRIIFGHPAERGVKIRLQVIFRQIIKRDIDRTRNCPALEFLRLAGIDKECTVSVELKFSPVNGNEWRVSWCRFRRANRIAAG